MGEWRYFEQSPSSETDDLHGPVIAHSAFNIRFSKGSRSNSGTDSRSLNPYNVPFFRRESYVLTNLTWIPPFRIWDVKRSTGGLLPINYLSTIDPQSPTAASDGYQTARHHGLGHQLELLLWPRSSLHSDGIGPLLSPISDRQRQVHRLI
jgi:hypothetical protein